jgi:hypothetical protein
MLLKGMVPLPELLNHTSQLAESFQVKHCWLLGWKRIWCRRVGRPTGRNGSMVAIDVSNDEVRIWAATDTDDLYLLTIQGMMGMRDGHPSRNSWG